MTIALGIGATTAIFSVVDATLLYPLPYHNRSSSSSIEDDLPGVNQIGNKLIAMAKDFPEEKYGFKVQKDERTFAQNLLHVAAVDYDLISRVSESNIGPDFGKDKHNPSRDLYKTKADVVKLIEQAVADGVAVIKQQREMPAWTKRRHLRGKPVSMWSATRTSGSPPSSTARNTSASWSSITARTTWHRRNRGGNAVRGSLKALDCNS